MTDLFPDIPETKIELSPKNKSGKATQNGIAYHHWMLKLHGVRSDTCGHCAFLKRTPETAKNYWKCSKSRTTRGPATDWRKKWQACGLFELDS